MPKQSILERRVWFCGFWHLAEVGPGDPDLAKCSGRFGAETQRLRPGHATLHLARKAGGIG